MTKKVSLALSLFSIFLFAELSAQNVYFTGLGRALVTNEELTDYTRRDSRLKSSGGYTLFDLGIYAKPNEALRAGVILRTRNEFGGFYGEGSSLEFRQMQLEGLISKQVKYEIGDVYLSHTRYTLWNEDNINGYNKYESNLFSLRRDIVNYENFFVGNNWRMQGFNAKAKANFKKGIQSLGIRAYGGRTRTTDFTTIPDRYFYGGRLDLTQSKYFRIAANAAAISDIAGTVKDNEVDYQNVVYTTDFALTLDNEKFKLAALGEVGASHFELSRSIDTVRHKFDDYFYDAGIEATYKPLNLVLGVSYRQVGFNFNSPMAQTRRVFASPDSSNMIYPKLNDKMTGRSVSQFDFYSQEAGLYNQAISTTLVNYYMPFDMVEPYGKATPNRQGLTITGEVQQKDEMFKAGVQANLLSEIVSEGDTVTKAKREFTKIQGGLVFNVNKLIKWKKLIAINAGMRTESSKRGGTNTVKLESSVLDLGLDIEVLKSLHVLGGTKMFTAKGSEVQAGRDELNQIVSFGSIFTNTTQNIIATGLRYDYDQAGYFSVQYHMIDYKDKTSMINDKYTMSQLFFVFGVKF